MEPIEIDQEYLDMLDFHTMPKDTGQIVTVSYAIDSEGLWRMHFDRSDNSESYMFAEYDNNASPEDQAFEPQNGILPAHLEWQTVIAV